MKDNNKNNSKPTSVLIDDLSDALDFKDIKGNVEVKRALEIAAAGFHHILLVGSQGCGKTMLAKSLYSIIPDMSEHETSFMSTIYENEGLLKKGELIPSRPFRSLTPDNIKVTRPYSDISVKFKQEAKRQGLRILEDEIDLARKGILFADELQDFHGPFQGSLKTYLDSDFCDFMLTATCLPIKGYDFLSTGLSTFPPEYAKVSDALLERIDIRIAVKPTPVINEIIQGSSHFVNVDDSAALKNRVMKAWEIQFNRYKEFSGLAVRKFNGKLVNKWVKHLCFLAEGCEYLLKKTVERKGLSFRSYYKVLKLARTIADLADSLFIHPVHLQEALQYRDLRWEKRIIPEDRNEEEKNDYFNEPG